MCMAFEKTEAQNAVPIFEREIRRHLVGHKISTFYSLDDRHLSTKLSEFRDGTKFILEVVPDADKPSNSDVSLGVFVGDEKTASFMIRDVPTNNAEFYVELRSNFVQNTATTLLRNNLCDVSP
jgi:hypothetical protein